MTADDWRYLASGLLAVVTILAAGGVVACTWVLAGRVAERAAVVYRRGRRYRQARR